MGLSDLFPLPEPGQGTLPGRSPWAGGSAASPSTILVVDDNEANRLLALSTLEDEGYRVVLASGGEEGVAAFEREAPDCVLLDVRMPEVDGFEVCRRIRALAGGVDTPVLFLTAQRDVDTFDQAIRSGGDDFLTKPFRPTELVVRVQAALKLQRMGVELRQYYNVLKNQRDYLLRLQLQKERLMAFVVHDLKNPVSAMDLNAQILLRDAALPESARELARQIRAEAQQLNRMILNLLDLSRAEEGKLDAKVSSVNLRAVVASVFDELKAEAQSREVSFGSDVRIEHLSADPDLLRRLLANLIENAVRHAPRGTAVTVTASQGDKDAELRIADAGGGVPVEMREKVFDPFVQVESGDRSRSRGGRGLGLAFCKSAVIAHGGRIWIEDAAPGAVFCVRLPHRG
jgi:two-component system, sensor histidine kinase and response regulator